MRYSAQVSTSIVRQAVIPCLLGAAALLIGGCHSDVMATTPDGE
jgi:hypothetical protein